MTPDNPWIAAESLASTLPASRQPTLAILDEIPHLVWNSGGILYHTVRGPEGWSAPVQIAMGSAPTLAVTSDNSLHCLFANQFAGNYEIYHSIWRGGHWSLPQNVSHTAGASTHPVVAVDPGGTLHALWADTTPGYSVIYHARREASFWSNMAIPNSRGENPTLAIAPDGTLYAGWQDRFSADELYDVFCAQSQQGQWALAENISDSPKADSILPSLAVDGRGFAHMVWQEQLDGVFQIYYSQRVPGAWTVPGSLTAGGIDCLFPRITSNPRTIVDLAWLEGNKLQHRSGLGENQVEWLAPETAASSMLGISDLAMGVSANGKIHLAWSALLLAGNSPLYYTQREPLLKHKYYVPIVGS